MTPAYTLEMARLVLNSPHKYAWSSYDEEADLLYVNFKKPAMAKDSELTDEDILFRHEGEEVVGLALLHAGKRSAQFLAAAPRKARSERQFGRSAKNRVYGIQDAP